MSRAQGPSCRAIRAPGRGPGSGAELPCNPGPTVCVAPACRGFGFRPSPGSGFVSRPSPAVCDPPMGGPSGLRSAHPGAKQFAIRPSDGSAVCDPPVRRLSGLRSAIEGPGGLRSANARAWEFAFRNCAGSLFALPSKARARHGLRSPRSSRPSANGAQTGGASALTPAQTLRLDLVAYAHGLWRFAFTGIRL